MNQDSKLDLFDLLAKGFPPGFPGGGGLNFSLNEGLLVTQTSKNLIFTHMLPVSPTNYIDCNSILVLQQKSNLFSSLTEALVNFMKSGTKAILLTIYFQSLAQ